MSSQYRRPRGTPKVALNLFVAPEVKNLIAYKLLQQARLSLADWLAGSTLAPVA